MEKEQIIYTGQAAKTVYTQALADDYTICYLPAEKIPSPEMLEKSMVFVIGEDVSNPARTVQQVYGINKHISIIVLASPSGFTAVKQAIQFSPFVGKNALVVSLSPDTDIESVCSAAATRTRQKRSFARLHLKPVQLQPGEKAKVSQMGTFLEHAPMGAILLSDDFRVQNYNQYARKLFPMLQMLDVALNNVLPEPVALQLTRFLGEAHDPEQKNQVNFQGKDLEITSSKILNEDGVPYHLLLISDVTERRAEVQRIHSILEGLPQMAWTTNAEGDATYFTQGWYHYTGQPKEEPYGTGWIKVIHPEDLERLGEAWQQSVTTGKPLQTAARYRNHQGEYRWHLTRASSIRNSSKEILMWVGTCTDIHDQILLTEELERKVRERTYSLEVSNSELEQFAHITSHDLQEPLRKIRTFAGILSDSSGAQLNEDGRRYLKKINDTAERMSNSLKALLNYTRAHRDDKFVETDLNQVVSNVLLDLELLIMQKKAKIETAKLPVVKAAPIQMQQLFYNLVNNALKFSRNGVAPEIGISCRTMDTEELLDHPSLQPYMLHYEITVSDNGIGFEPEYAEKIFTIFQRLHNRSAYEGTGIGLSLVKRVMHNHKGEVFATSMPGEGATFHLVLPAVPGE